MTNKISNTTTGTISAVNKILTNSKYLMRLGHMNVGSIPSCVDELRIILEQTGMDIMGISESWLKPSTPKILYEINEYKILRHDRLRCKGGGLAFYHKKNLKSKIINKSSGNSRFEYFYVQFTLGGQILNIC